MNRSGAYPKWIRKVSVLILLLISTTFAAGGPDAPLELWYDQPAEGWDEALPVGNGRLGAMVFGRPGNERIQLNEDTLWAGQPYSSARTVQPEVMQRIQQSIFEKNFKQANKLASKHLLGKPTREMPYQPLGVLNLTFDGLEADRDYHRALNLRTAIASTRYTHDGVTYRRKVFSSPVDEVIVVRIEASEPGSIHFESSLTTKQDANVSTINKHTLQIDGTNAGASGIEGTMGISCRIRVRTEGGSVQSRDNQLVVHNADAATLLVAADTDHNGPKDISGNALKRVKQAMAGVSNKTYKELRAAHVEEHQRLFDRVSLDLGNSSSTVENRPTGERLSGFDLSEDPQLARLFFQHARYLMISSSRPGSQPINLQGIWNNSMKPPWESNYTININTQMNYWIAEAANLPECHQPLIRMVRELARTNGATVAEQTYNADGWLAHHNVDLWRRASATDGIQWGQSQSGGAWLAQHLWWHYQFSGDEQYLESVYPIFKEASQFFLDTLVEHPKFGWLVTNPSLSPEHKHRHGTPLCAGPTIDMQVIRDLFTWTIKSARILDRDQDVIEKLKKTREQLAPNQIGRHGQLQEWLHDWDDPNDHHRHLSHLYGVFPGNQISPGRTPELAEAARTSLRMRDAGGVAKTWIAAWKSAIWSQYGRSENAGKRLQELLTGSTQTNMFCHYGGRMQVDSNFGGAMAILQMLLQSDGGRIDLLPALPSEWETGSVEGLRARGNFEIDLHWENGQLQRATVHSEDGNECTLHYDGSTVTFETNSGETIHVNGDLRKIEDEEK